MDKLELTFEKLSNQSRSFSLLQLTTIAGSIGILFGLFEGIVHWLRMMSGNPQPMDHEILWAVPLIYGFLFALFALFAGLLFKGFSRLFFKKKAWFKNQLIIDVVILVGFANSIFLFLSINKFAVFILALGLTFQTHLLLNKNEGKGVNLLEKYAVYLFAVVGFLFLSVSIGNEIYRRSVTSNHPPPGGDRPNVLLITLDTLRADHLGTYGYHRPTPSLDQFAKEGLQFEYALATSSWTLPSHATIMTGLYSYEHQAEHSTGGRLDEKYFTLAEAFSEEGYITAAFTANELWGTVNQGFRQGFSHFNNVLWGIEDTFRFTNIGRTFEKSLRRSKFFDYYNMGRKTADQVNREFIDWSSSSDKQPFFVWLNYFDPHHPYYAPPPYDMQYGDLPAIGDRSYFDFRAPSIWSGDLSEKEKEIVTDGYDSAIYYMDSRLGQLFQFLKDNGMYDNTIIIITSDHGEGFGEHGLYGHGNSLYRENLHVPLLIRYPPMVEAGGHYEETVSLRDLAATITQLAGFSDSSLFPGTPFLELPPQDEFALAELFHKPRWNTDHPVALGNLTSFTTDNYHTVFSEEIGEVYAFDDKFDQEDLSDTTAGKEELESHKNDLERINKQQFHE